MKSVLVVEDYPSLQTLYKFALQKAGYAVDICDDSETALRMTAQRAYDVILLDLLLRRGSGLGFLKAFKQRHLPKASQPKIVVISNIKHPAVAKEADRLGATAYYVKSSSSPKDIAQAVDNATRDKGAA